MMFFILCQVIATNILPVKPELNQVKDSTRESFLPAVSLFQISKQKTNKTNNTEGVYLYINSLTKEVNLSQTLLQI